MSRDRVLCCPHYQPPTAATGELVRQLTASGWGLLPANGRGLIDLVRSEVASAVLEMPGIEWVLWVDGDNTCTREGVEQMVETAERHAADVVAAPYTLRMMGGRLTTEFEFQSPEWPTARRDEVVLGERGYVYPIRQCGFGMTLTRHSLYRRLRDSGKIPAMTSGTPERKGWLFFECGLVEGRYTGEDYRFCRAAREIGARMVADTRVLSGHIGEHEYTVHDLAPVGPRPATVTIRFRDEVPV